LLLQEFKMRSTIILALALCSGSYAFVPKHVSRAPALPVRSTEEPQVESTAPPAMSSSAGAAAISPALANLKTMQNELCPSVPFFDPLKLSELELWEETQEASIGFLRQAEIKHGRVAMAGFVGFLVHANNIRWPFAMKLDGTKWPTLEEAGSVPALWDKLPEASKWQIILFIGALEWFDEYHLDEFVEGKPKHYMRGGMPGAYPNLSGVFGLPLNLFDPFGLSAKRTEEQKARGRLMEINNGRLAMIGLFGFLSEATVPGSVPSLTGLIAPYSGNVMIPFQGDFTLLVDAAASASS